MFESFFPKPKLFLVTLLLWLAFVIFIYYSIGQSLGELIGFQFSDEGAPTVIGLGYFVTPEFLWFDFYYIISTLIFFGFWAYYSPHKWQIWSILGSSVILFVIFFSRIQSVI